MYLPPLIFSFLVLWVGFHGVSCSRNSSTSARRPAQISRRLAVQNSSGLDLSHPRKSSKSLGPSLSVSPSDSSALDSPRESRIWRRRSPRASDSASILFSQKVCSLAGNPATSRCVLHSRLSRRRDIGTALDTQAASRK